MTWIRSTKRRKRRLISRLRLRDRESDEPIDKYISRFHFGWTIKCRLVNLGSIGTFPKFSIMYIKRFRDLVVFVINILHGQTKASGSKYSHRDLCDNSSSGLGSRL